MKLIMQVLCPVIYELVPPEAIGKLTYIPYPDPGNNVNDLWEAKKTVVYGELRGV
jgi:hypothetical protein